ncbi:hypothetical protein [Tardiphaga sp. 839_C3_N1_4]|uniref:hypothetical protein n=1 Tax=Tardiphaga sp. 839_C3_N1_4 TaxID=3240761 RepID=UPI003F20D444
MTANQALQTARDLGIAIKLSGNGLLLSASFEPPAGVVKDLVRHKLEILGILAPTETALTAEDWLVSFDERAGIAEFDGGLPRELAELQAIGSCVLDEAMGRTEGGQIEQFVRSLPTHIRSAGNAVETIKLHPGELEISETTP